MFKPVSSRLDDDKDRVCYMYSMLWMTTGITWRIESKETES